MAIQKEESSSNSQSSGSQATTKIESLLTNDPAFIKQLRETMEELANSPGDEADAGSALNFRAW